MANLSAKYSYEQEFPSGGARCCPKSGAISTEESGITSGLEMAQNPMRINRTTQEVDAKLHSILKSIHTLRVEFGNHSDGFVNYVNGANLSGFIKVANAMRDQGLV